MRDIVVAALVLGSLPFVVRKPFIGVLVWAWLGFMNPHRLCWGFAFGFPFAQIVAITLLGSFIISKEPKKIPWTPISVLLIVFIAFMFITTLSAFNQYGAWVEWNKIWKIQLLTFVMMVLLTSRERVEALVAVIVISLGFYGVKGGIFTLLTGGGNRVWGPPGSFISGNNEIGLALNMTIPLMRYFQLSSSSKRIRQFTGFSIVLTVMSVLATHSRGALLGLVAMAMYLVFKSRNKITLIIFLGGILVGGLLFMPTEWWDRMHTIESHDRDESALQRFNSWHTAFNIAKDNPILGGGFNTFIPFVFRLYAPNPDWVYDAHSIYFEVMGEHGFVGLTLFLGLGILALKEANRIRRVAALDPRIRWMGDLSSMIYVSLIGYAISGLFLGLAYFDLYYSLLAILVALNRLLKRHQENVDKYANDQKVPAKSFGEKERIGTIKTIKHWYDSL